MTTQEPQGSQETAILIILLDIMGDSGCRCNLLDLLAGFVLLLLATIFRGTVAPVVGQKKRENKRRT